MTHTHTHTTRMTSQCVTLQDDSENEQAMSVTCARMKQPERTVEVFTPDWDRWNAHVRKQICYVTENSNP